uniref:DUF4283 domain-containing protein n=1 Tax=Tanacetum cinerariifolium TaxID=118510 RepID=A0A6L2KP98_TANCI|nr:hypothetical protein [Tanacetum cinerariifolium]
MEKSDKLNVREGTAGIQGAGASVASYDGSLKVSNYSPLVSYTAPINMQQGLDNVHVVVTFGVPLTTVGDLDVLTKDIKLVSISSGMTNDNHKAVMDALVAMCDSVQAINTNVDAIPCMVSHVDDSIIVDSLVAKNLNVDESLIIYSIFIQDKPSSYIAIAEGSQPKTSVAGGSKLVPSISKANFCSLFLENLCQGVYVFILRKVVEMNNDELQRFFLLSIQTLKGLEDVLKNGPWMIRNSPIILKKWSMSTHLSKEELTRILVWVKIHDVPIQFFSEDGLSIITSQIEDVLQESLTIGVTLIDDTRFTIEIVTIEYEWKPPRCDLCKIFGHVHDHFPKKVSIPITVVTSNVPTPTC